MLKRDVSSVVPSTKGIKRVVVLVMDSFGIGAAHDAPSFGDAGADTFGHLLSVYYAKKGRWLSLPNLMRYGLGEAYRISTGHELPSAFLDVHANVRVMNARYGALQEVSHGKDTPSGHWELAGVPVEFEWGYFQQGAQCFPAELIHELVQRAGLPGVLGEKHASGTDILEELGDLHCQTGKPIVYTSADSVFQIAAHEDYFGLDRLYDLCKIARELVDPYKIGRVIARPFVGEKGHYVRTGNRKDLAVLPPKPTLLDRCLASGIQVIGIGKIPDIYAHQGFSQEIKAHGNQSLFDETLKAVASARETSSFIMTNFVDFDSLYGHRRDVIGYAEALEAFDRRLPELEALLGPEDWIVLTADHGCDPTFPGSDHTREHVPALFWSQGFPDARSLGLRSSFADVGQTIACHFGLSESICETLAGTPCWK